MAPAIETTIRFDSSPTIAQTAQATLRAATTGDAERFTRIAAGQEPFDFGKLGHLVVVTLTQHTPDGQMVADPNMPPQVFLLNPIANEFSVVGDEGQFMVAQVYPQTKSGKLGPPTAIGFVMDLEPLPLPATNLRVVTTARFAAEGKEMTLPLPVLPTSPPAPAPGDNVMRMHPSLRIYVRLRGNPNVVDGALGLVLSVNLTRDVAEVMCAGEDCTPQSSDNNTIEVPDAGKLTYEGRDTTCPLALAQVMALNAAANMPLTSTPSQPDADRNAA